MTYKVENSLTNFQFWSGAKTNADMLTYSELERLDDILSDMYGEDDLVTETYINDLMWFEFETICDWLDLKYNKQTGEVVRDEDEDEDDEITFDDEDDELNGDYSDVE